MATEIELKLRFTPQDISRLTSKLTQIADYQRTDDLRNHYFDTQDAKLSAAGCALRIRQRGDRWEQTLKTRGRSTAGLQQRGEWNWPLSNNQLNTALFDQPDVQAHWPDQVDHKQLLPLFGTHFQRSTWIWQQQDNCIEIVIDQGNVSTATRQQSLCEIELELRSGTADSLWKLAATLSDTLPLWISDISKAERGYSLAIEQTNWSPDWRLSEQQETLQSLNTLLTCLKRQIEALLWRSGSNEEKIADVDHASNLLKRFQTRGQALSIKRQPDAMTAIHALTTWLNDCKTASLTSGQITDTGNHNSSQALLTLASWVWQQHQ